MIINSISRQSFLHFIKPRYLRLIPSISSGTYCQYKSSSSSISYYVLVPETPEELSANNIRLDVELQNFTELTSENCYSGMGKHSLDYETNIWDIAKKLKDNNYEKSFDAVIGEIDKLDAGLTYAWGTVRNFYSARNDVLSRANYLKIHDRARKARGNKFQSRPIYNACKEIYVTSELSDVQKRVIQKFILEGRLNGLELPPEEYEPLLQTLKTLGEIKANYLGKLNVSSARFSYFIMDREIVQDFPPDLLKRMSYNTEDPTKGPWTVTHHPQIYEPFLKYCPDRDIRWNAWNAFVKRSSSHLERELDNGIHVEEIRGARKEQAKYLGYESFADMSMETKMAGSVDNVLTLLGALFNKAKESQTEEIKVLKEFAQREGFEHELEEYDIPYWRRKHLQHITPYDDIRIEEYFDFKNVWEQLLSLSSNLFGIHFEEAEVTVSSSSSDSKVKVWAPDVRFYNVFDSSGKKVAAFYFDALRRPKQKIESSSNSNSSWMLSLKSRCDALNYLPVANLLFNFPAPTEEDQVTLLTFEDVQTLFQKFGHALQHLLTTVPYTQVAGLTNIEWDALEVCSYFMQYWLSEPSVLEKLAKHYKTGEKLPTKYINNIFKTQTHMAGYDLCNELFLAHFDIKLYAENTHWLEILRELAPLYKPFKLNKEYSLPCWFSPIITDIWAAAYYSHTWSKMIAADAFSAFKENDPQEITTTGRRFRETFLSLGGGTHSAEVFRQFRGRDPTPEALLKVLSIS